MTKKDFEKVAYRLTEITKMDGLWLGYQRKQVSLPVVVRGLIEKLWIEQITENKDTDFLREQAKNLYTSPGHFLFDEEDKK